MISMLLGVSVLSSVLCCVMILIVFFSLSMLDMQVVMYLFRLWLISRFGWMFQVCNWQVSVYFMQNRVDWVQWVCFSWGLLLVKRMLCMLQLSFDCSRFVYLFSVCWNMCLCLYSLWYMFVCCVFCLGNMNIMWCFFEWILWLVWVIFCCNVLVVEVLLVQVMVQWNW